MAYWIISLNAVQDSSSSIGLSGDQRPSDLQQAQQPSDASTSSTAAPSSALASLMPTPCSECSRLRQQCKLAWSQVAELKVFLNDYGLVWVGDQQPQQDEPAQQGTAASTAMEAAVSTEGPINHPGAEQLASACTASASTSLALPFDMSDLMECIDSLNKVASEAGPRPFKSIHGPYSSSSPTPPAQASSSASSPSKPSIRPACSSPSNWSVFSPEQATVNLVIFRDGLQLGTDPPWPYSDATATAVLCDIFDGYFPGVLKREYPDGVTIELQDCSGKTLAQVKAGAEGGSGKVLSFSELGNAPIHLNKVRGVGKDMGTIKPP